MGLTKPEVCGKFPDADRSRVAPPASPCQGHDPDRVGLRVGTLFAYVIILRQFHYDTDGGTAVQSQSVKKGGTLNEPNEPKKQTSKNCRPFY